MGKKKRCYLRKQSGNSFCACVSVVVISMIKDWKDLHETYASSDIRCLFRHRNTIRNADFSIQRVFGGITTGIRVSVCDGLNYKPVLYVSFRLVGNIHFLCANCCHSIMDIALHRQR